MVASKESVRGPQESDEMPKLRANQRRLQQNAGQNLSVQNRSTLGNN